MINESNESEINNNTFIFLVQEIGKISGRRKYSNVTIIVAETIIFEKLYDNIPN